MVKPVKAKTRKKARLGSPILFTGGLKTLVLSTFPYVIVLALVGGFCGSVFAYAVNSPTFQLEEVVVRNVGSLTPAQAFEFCELRPGENLVSIDLVNVQQVIKRKHPEFKEVRVRRILPNRIEAILKRRTPVAQIDYARFVQIDKDLVILPGSAASAFKNLTIIEGAPLPKPGLFVGASITDATTKKALKLAEIVKAMPALKNHALSKIDIRDPKNLSLIVDGDLEIRLGNAHLIERLKILEQTLKTVDLNRAAIQYIDLRFDDVVIGPR